MGRARHVIWPNQKTLYFSYSYTVILTSILAAGIVQNTFAGEAIGFLSQITNTRTRIRNVRTTYVYIPII